MEGQAMRMVSTPHGMFPKLPSSYGGAQGPENSANLRPSFMFLPTSRRPCERDSRQEPVDWRLLTEQQTKFESGGQYAPSPPVNQAFPKLRRNRVREQKEAIWQLSKTGSLEQALQALGKLVDGSDGTRLLVPNFDTQKLVQRILTILSKHLRVALQTELLEVVEDALEEVETAFKVIHAYPCNFHKAKAFVGLCEALNANSSAKQLQQAIRAAQRSGLQTAWLTAARDVLKQKIHGAREVQRRQVALQRIQMWRADASAARPFGTADEASSWCAEDERNQRPGDDCDSVTQIRTHTSSAVAAGSRILTVRSQEGFQIGDAVLVGGQEEREIVAFGSLVLSKPLQKAYPAGTEVVRLPVSTAAATTSTAKVSALQLQEEATLAESQAGDEAAGSGGGIIAKLTAMIVGPATEAAPPPPAEDASHAAPGPTAAELPAASAVEASGSVVPHPGGEMSPSAEGRDSEAVHFAAGAALATARPAEESPLPPQLPEAQEHLEEVAAEPSHSNALIVEEDNMDVSHQLTTEESSSSEFKKVMAGDDDTKLGTQLSAMPPGYVELVGVVPGSWAERVGLEVGDLLVEVNGKDLAGMSAESFKQQFTARPLHATFVRRADSDGEQDDSFIDEEEEEEEEEEDEVESTEG